MQDPFLAVPQEIMLYLFGFMRASRPMLCKASKRWRAALINTHALDIDFMQHAAITGYKIYLGELTHCDIKNYLADKQHHVLMRANYTWKYDCHNPNLGFLRDAFSLYMTDMYAYGVGHDNAHDVHEIRDDQYYSNATGKQLEQCNFVDALFQRIISKYVGGDADIVNMVMMTGDDNLIREAHRLGRQFTSDAYYQAINTISVEALYAINCPFPDDIIEDINARRDKCTVRDHRELYGDMILYIKRKQLSKFPVIIFDTVE